MSYDIQPSLQQFGLPNIENTCYIDSVMQLVVSTSLARMEYKFKKETDIM